MFDGTVMTTDSYYTFNIASYDKKIPVGIYVKDVNTLTTSTTGY